MCGAFVCLSWLQLGKVKGFWNFLCGPLPGPAKREWVLLLFPTGCSSPSCDLCCIRGSLQGNPSNNDVLVHAGSCLRLWAVDFSFSGPLGKWLYPSCMGGLWISWTSTSLSLKRLFVILSLLLQRQQHYYLTSNEVTEFSVEWTCSYQFCCEESTGVAFGSWCSSSSLGRGGSYLLHLLGKSNKGLMPVVVSGRAFSWD